MRSKVGLRYATAILEGAGEELQTVVQDLEVVKDTIKASRELRQLLKSPIVKNDDKILILKQIFIGRISLKTLESIELLVRKGRSELILDTIEEFERLLDKRNGVVNAEVASAIELDESQKQQVQARLEKLVGQKIRLQTKVQPDLIGGLTVRIGDTVIDYSIKHQLARLRERLKQGSLN
ncbi:MAG: ATP synthase F1 subunit delta [Candidatus Thermochlorobacter aerophilum]|jgi:F-type H+-transporting ATPase subunit delta|uniref:ATP synthase subunit delta n=1 Tax=Candidatus Thermochlorobacter aerophilus TaxID=1868324 RepID=A0A395M2M9_9BACT|nr:MAG: ATP synthase F1 subunit delta [Candidatus Thermochlorobacter aerophilum]